MRAHTVHSFLTLACGIALTVTPGWASSQELYRLIDLGTLGGSSSRGDAINSAGQICGGSSIADSSEGHAFFWDGKTMQDLGTLGSSIGCDEINAAGQVTGTGFLPGAGSNHAYVWDGATFKVLGTLGGTNSRAAAINSSGLVVGSADVADFQEHAFLWDGTTMRDLGTLGGLESEARDINANGQVTGFALGPKGVRAFLWNGTGMKDLGTLGGTNSAGNAINASGHVTGRADISGGGWHAYIWNGTSMEDLGTLEGAISEVSEGSAINALGQVTGSSSNAQGFERAFLWDGNRMRNLGNLGGRYSRGTGINDFAVVIGTASLPEGDPQQQVFRPFVSIGGAKMKNLNEVIDPSDPLKSRVELFEASDVNNRGQISATGRDSRTFATHAYLVTPLQYKIAFTAPTTGSAWKQGTTVPIKIRLVDVNGERISDSRAASLVAMPCKVKFSAKGAQPRTAVCMKYDANANLFYINWKLGTSSAGATTLTVAATYKFSMPETITTKRSRTITITQ